MTWLLDRSTETLAMPAWLAGAAVVLLVVLGALALRPTRSGVLGVAALILLGAVAVFAGLDRADRAARRHALEARIAALTARGLAPGSTLACLDDGAGETVGSACEKVVFARPEAAAAAVSYVGARLDLLAALERSAARSDDFAGTLAGLRRSIELDRFGIVAHVLSRRDGCTVEACAAFALLQDSSAVKANLKGHAYDQYVERYAADWARAPAPSTPVAKAAPDKPAEPPTPVAAATPVQAPAPRTPTMPFEYPSAASIPPVSIMNPEPPMTAGSGGEPSQAKTPPAPKRAQDPAPPAAATR